ncbi:MAG: hypothetical protein J6Y21_09175 [Clostridia bacterium]|nr:hypothetical protein [Clostridia bacterium]
MKKSGKSIYAIIAAILCAIIVLGAAAGCNKTPANNDPGTGENTEAPVDTATEEPEVPKYKVLAHWKLQNQEGYYTGSVDDDTIGFKDLSGNGNDLIAKVAGNGDQLDIFSWDNDVDSAAFKFGSGLKFNNTKALAATVDPYKASETSYTGGYTSGKYLETVKGAPINSSTFDGGFSIEVIFKLSKDLDNEYNRYTGMFSRQGVIEDQNEPPFSIAISEWNNDAATGTINENETWLQLLIVNDYTKLNHEMDEILVAADTWHHVLITLDDLGKVLVYLDGEKLFDTWSGFEGIFCTDPDFSWEVGVGRKFGGDHKTDSKNENSPEGMIRRLFAGSIAEIRITDKPIEVADSLFASEFIKEK